MDDVDDDEEEDIDGYDRNDDDYRDVDVDGGGGILMIIIQASGGVCSNLELLQDRQASSNIPSHMIMIYQIQIYHPTLSILCC